MLSDEVKALLTRLRNASRQEQAATAALAKLGYDTSDKLMAAMAELIDGD